MGALTRPFRRKETNEKDVANADENHFRINMDNGPTLGFPGKTDIKYADLVSRGKAMTSFCVSIVDETQKQSQLLWFFKTNIEAIPHVMCLMMCLVSRIELVQEVGWIQLLYYSG